MSKKIKISLTNERPNLIDLFHKTLDRKIEESKNSRRYDPYEEMSEEEILWAMHNGFLFDGGEDYEDPDLVWPPTPKPKTKGKGKKKNSDPYEEYWNKLAKKKKHRGGKKGNKARVININEPYSGDEEDPTETLYPNDDDVEYTAYESSSEFKLIWFYPDYHDMNDRLEFDSLKDFDDFCADEGYVVPPYVGEDIAYRNVSHCCLNPTARENGVMEIMAEDDYASMFYEACETNELGY